MFHNLYPRQSLINLSLGVIFSIASISSASANVTVVEDKKAQIEPTSISVIAGKTSSIIFQNDEIIFSTKISDLSNNVVETNVPIESGQARSVYLNLIQTLEIPLATTTSNPNLFITTTNSEGQEKEYEFILFNQNEGSEGYRIAVQPTPPPPAPKPKPKPIPKPQNIIQTSLGEASPEDVELGLDIKIKNGQLSEKDPIVLPIREFIAQTRNNSATPAKDVADSNDIPLALLAKFGELGLQEDTRRRLTPLPDTLTFKESSQAIQNTESDINNNSDRSQNSLQRRCGRFTRGC